MDSHYYALYSTNNIRTVANRLSKKYCDLNETHVYWIAKELNIYPDAQVHKRSKSVDMGKTGKINRDNTEFVNNGKLNEKGIQAIESYLLQEGYKADSNYKEEAMEQKPKPKQNTNIWEQADLIAMMKNEYEKAVSERDAAKSEADQFAKMADKYEKEIEELKDKLIISEKENCSLKSEKQELSKMQIKTVDFGREIDSLQERIGKYNQEINACLSDMNILRKDISALQTRANKLWDDKKKLEGVLSDLVGCSKRLMNMK